MALSLDSNGPYSLLVERLEEARIQLNLAKSALETNEGGETTTTVPRDYDYYEYEAGISTLGSWRDKAQGDAANVAALCRDIIERAQARVETVSTQMVNEQVRLRQAQSTDPAEQAAKVRRILGDIDRSSKTESQLNQVLSASIRTDHCAILRVLEILPRTDAVKELEQRFATKRLMPGQNVVTMSARRGVVISVAPSVKSADRILTVRMVGRHGVLSSDVEVVAQGTVLPISTIHATSIDAEHPLNAPTDTQLDALEVMLAHGNGGVTVGCSITNNMAQDVVSLLTDCARATHVLANESTEMAVVLG